MTQMQQKENASAGASGTFVLESRKIVLGYVALCLGLMFIASFGHMLTNSSHLLRPVEQARQAQQDAAPAARPEGAMGGQGAMSPENMDKLNELMAAYKEKPNDFSVLMDLGEHFLRAGEWQNSAMFFKKATEADPKETDAYFLLGFSLYNAGDNAGAAVSFEELLAIKKDPKAMFNLALVYKHELNEVEKGQELFRQLIALPEAPEDLRAKAREELGVAGR